MAKFLLWAREKTLTTGTGDITLAGPISGYASFQSQAGVGDYVFYAITDNTTDRELGIAMVVSATMLRRTTIRATLAGGLFKANPTAGLNLSGAAQVYSPDSAQLLTWAEGIRLSAGHQGDTLVVGTNNIATLSNRLDAGIVP